MNYIQLYNLILGLIFWQPFTVLCVKKDLTRISLEHSPQTMCRPLFVFIISFVSSTYPFTHCFQSTFISLSFSFELLEVILPLVTRRFLPPFPLPFDQLEEVSLSGLCSLCLFAAGRRFSIGDSCLLGGV